MYLPCSSPRCAGTPVTLGIWGSCRTSTIGSVPQVFPTTAWSCWCLWQWRVLELGRYGVAMLYQYTALLFVICYEQVLSCTTAGPSPRCAEENCITDRSPGRERQHNKAGTMLWVPHSGASFCSADGFFCLTSPLSFSFVFLDVLFLFS